eukprot:COSAG01_NODE_19171_length_1026_cov_1.830636_1_plen_20_part_10
MAVTRVYVRACVGRLWEVPV